MIIEDDHDIRVTLRYLLEDEGFEVYSEANGRDGLETLKRVPPSYPQDHPRADLLRRKGLAAYVCPPDGLAATPDLLDFVTSHLRLLGRYPVTGVLEAGRGLLAGSPVKVALAFAALIAAAAIMTAFARRGLASAERAG